MYFYKKKMYIVCVFEYVPGDVATLLGAHVYVYGTCGVCGGERWGVHLRSCVCVCVSV
jgi:hypothetical protein